MKVAAILWSVVVLATSACVAEAADSNGGGQEPHVAKILLKVIRENQLFGPAAKPLKMDDAEIVNLKQSLRVIFQDYRKIKLSECSKKPSDGNGTDQAAGCFCRSLAADEAVVECAMAYLNDGAYRMVNASRQKLANECAKISNSSSACDNATQPVERLGFHQERNARVTFSNLQRTICQELKKQTDATQCARDAGSVRQSVCRSLSSFGLNLFKKLAKQDNFVYSPFSVGTTLSMLLAGADGTTKDALETILFSEVPSVQKHFVHDDIGQLLRAVSVENNSAVNRLYLEVRLSVHQSYANVLSGCYNSDLEKVDFNEPEPTRIIINAFVQDNTRGKIKDLIPRGAIDSNTVMVLINALYFQGAWLKPFDSKLTKPGTFYTLSGAEVTVPMMFHLHVDIRHSFSAKLDAQLLLLPYTAGNRSMAIFLPSQRHGIVDLVKQMTSTLILAALREAKPTTIMLTFPKFSTTTSAGDIRDTLISLGAMEMFESFKNISPSGDFKVSAVFHAAAIEVDERGTTAGAATGAIMGRSGPPWVVADHPFLYAIIDQSNCEFNMLFLGQLTDPTVS